MIKLVDKKMGAMITDKSTTLMNDIMTTVDQKMQKMMKTIEAKFNGLETSVLNKMREGDDKLGDRIDDVLKQLKKIYDEVTLEMSELILQW